MKDIHFWGGVGWIAALALVALLGDRRGLLRTARDLERLQPSRFNVGQKINALLTAAFAMLFLASGLLLCFGERDTRFRWASTVLLHDGLLYASLMLLAGHLYLALIHPATRHSLRGMTTGKVSEDVGAAALPALDSTRRPTERQRPASPRAVVVGEGLRALRRTDAERHLDVLATSRCG